MVSWRVNQQGAGSTWKVACSQTMRIVPSALRSGGSTGQACRVRLENETW